jgi:hypothetical protein
VRGLVLALGLALAGAAVVALALGDVAAAAGLAVWAAVLLGGVAIERWRYKRLGTTPAGAGWQTTGERFLDPESGLLVTVYFNPTTGERRYVSG